MARPKKTQASGEGGTPTTAASGNAHRGAKRKSLQTVVRNIGGRVEQMRQDIRDLERRLG